MAPGIEMSEILPLHAQHADKFSLVRSCYHTAAAVHDTGHQMMQTGRLFTGGINTPHAGCALAYLRGRRSDLPAHVVLPEPMGPTGGNLPHGQDAGFLGKAYDPFALMADPSKANFKVPDLLPPAEIGEVRLERRRRMRAIVDETVANFEASDNAKLLDSNFEAAFRMMTSPQARAAFDLSKEPTAVRERYGMNRFGQCCLLARRLIEAGVRFVTVNTFLTVFNEITWDIHGSSPFTSIEGMKDIVAPDVRPGLHGAARRSEPARHARQHAGLQPGRVRPHAAGQSGRRTRPLAAVLDRVLRRRRRARRPRGGPQRSHRRRAGRAPGRSRPKSWPRSIAAWDSTWKRSCPARKAGRSRWSTPASTRSTSCFSALEVRRPCPTIPPVKTGATDACHSICTYCDCVVLTRCVLSWSSPPAAHADGSAAAAPRRLHARGARRRGSRWSSKRTTRPTPPGKSPTASAFESSDAKVVKIEDGVAIPVANGTATITATAGERSAAVQVTVTAMDQPFAWSFRNHVESVLSKAGCNSGACHGALAGKKGFKLSLGAFDPVADYFYITRQARARRVVLSDPGRSLVLTKPSGAVPHKGGRAILASIRPNIASWPNGSPPAPPPRQTTTRGWRGWKSCPRPRCSSRAPSSN